MRSHPDAAKRTKLVEKLIASPEFGKNWSRYWRDVIYMTATEPRARLAQGEFETWMANQWNKGIGWNFTVTEMLTAMGEVKENPQTVLFFTQSGETEDIAAEACRISVTVKFQPIPLFH